MPLQNRVDPFGAIHAVAARGTFTGNRGVIHDPGTRTLLPRRWTTKAWIICTCEFRGRRRAVMGRNAASGNAGWTELFFLDEVTALAAGHRPCFHCRRAEAEAFRRRAGGDGMRAPEMDAVLHGERLAAGGEPPPVATAELSGLPDGAMVASGGRAFAVRRGALMEWSFSGYGPPRPAEAGLSLRLLTPRFSVEALRRGYRPAWHASAGAAPHAEAAT